MKYTFIYKTLVSVAYSELIILCQRLARRNAR